MYILPVCEVGGSICNSECCLVADVDGQSVHDGGQTQGRLAYVLQEKLGPRRAEEVRLLRQQSFQGETFQKCVHVCHVFPPPFLCAIYFCNQL